MKSYELATFHHAFPAVSVETLYPTEVISWLPDLAYRDWTFTKDDRITLLSWQQSDIG